MDIATSKWFSFLNENKTIITEGLDDIGLPQYVIDYINKAMPEAPEKSKVLVGNLWKQSEIGESRVDTYVSKMFDIIWKNYLDPDIRPPIGGDIEGQAKFIERAKFLIQTLTKTVKEKKYGTWNKAFRKAVNALRKAGADPEKIEETKADLDNYLKAAWHNWWASYDTIGAFLNDDPTNYELAKEAYDQDTMRIDIDELETIVTMYFENKEDPDKVVHRFEDGSYWYDLDASNCPLEAERMGHCGSDNRGTLYSLRKLKKGRRASSSYITMTVRDDYIYQIKGRNNAAPPEETWDHIVWFINEYGIEHVEETGEHSDDREGLQEMTEYLSENTNAKFSGNVQDRIEEIEQNVRTIDNQYSALIEEALENVDAIMSIYCAVEDSEEYGGDAGSVYLSMGYSLELMIELGWPDFVVDDGFYRATIGDSAEDQTVDDRYEGIPTSTWGSDARDFSRSLDGASYDPPYSDDGETEWRVEKDPEVGVSGVHLIIEFRGSRLEHANDDNDASEYDYFADEVKTFAENLEDAISDIRSTLTEDGYAKKTQFENDLEFFEEEMADLENWTDGSVTGGGTALVWIGTGADISNRNSVTDQSLAELPMEYNFYNNNSIIRRQRRAGMLGAGEIFSMVFREPGRTLNSVFNSFLAASVIAAIEPSKSQLSLNYGPNYEAKAAKAILANDGDFTIVPVSRSASGYRAPDLTILWKYVIKINRNSPEKEFEVAGDIAKLLNANPEIINSAVNKTIRHYRNISDKEIAQNVEKLTSSKNLIDATNKIIDDYSQPPNDSFVDAAQLVLMAKWMQANVSKMNNIEKYVSYVLYLDTLSRGLQPTTHQRFIKVDPPDVGKPQTWDDQVQSVERAMGSVKPVRRSENRDHSIESQIERIDNLIKEIDSSYDLRIYKIQVGCSIDKNIGGTESETATEIRGIQSVTTVRPVAARKRDMTPTSEFVLYDIKFELIGASSRKDYLENILLPNLRKIKGLRIISVSKVTRANRRGSTRNIQESKILKEYGMGSGYGYTANGGGASNLGKQRRTHGREMTTPRPQLQSMLDDWSQGGVMAYDAPTNHTDMRYHVMMPVEELWPLINSEEYSGSKKDFQGEYRNFISTGADAPVYLALGQNGIVKITGGEDQVWFAKESGLEELPVFLSYQKQV